MKFSAKEHLVFGLHAVQSLLPHRSNSITHVCVQKERCDQKIESIVQLTKQHRIRLEYLPRQEIDRITEQANHQGVVAFCAKAKHYTEHDLKKILENLSAPPFILILDGVQDPHNFGACFRSADAAGVHAIIAPKDKSVGFTPIVSKVASGAMETIPFVQVTNLVRVLDSLKKQGIWIYGAAAEADQTVFETNLSGPIAIVLGAEGSGLRRLTREHCDVLVKIPMKGHIASLNISVATGIFLFEVVRQRG